MPTDAEPCTPIPTADFFGLDTERENADATETEYRSSCVFVKRITEKRKKARDCFSATLSPSPPPPPPSEEKSAQQALTDARERRIRGEGGAYSAGALGEEDEYVRELDEQISTTNGMISQLGENDPILRNILAGVVRQMETSRIQAQDSAAARQTVVTTETTGRRLMQRMFSYASSMADALIDHPIMRQFKTGISGVNIAACEALCEAISVDTNITDATECRAFAHKRDNPFSLTDLTGRCFLLKAAGACKPEDFAAGLYTRQLQSEDICHDPTPGYADELCLQLPTTRYDTRVMTHADAAAIAAQTPRTAAPGSGGLPRPRTALEAGFFVAIARQDGVYSFWAASPDSSEQDITTHWYTMGGINLVYKKGEYRCILVSSSTSSTSSKMYAKLEPCE